MSITGIQSGVLQEEGTLKKSTGPSRILYTCPSITEREIAYATDAAANGWGARCYDYIHRFESEFARWLGVKHAVATSSCTGALHLGLAALGIGPGDEVIVPDVTWIASAAPITYLGATPVLVDIEPDSWCIDPVAVEAAITARTKAVIAVHLYGNVAALSALRRLCEAHGLALIEDAAEALGSAYLGRRVGSIGHFGTFSFHGTKTLTTGEGGMFVTQDSDLYARVMTLNNHGRSPAQSRQFWSEVMGYKYRMSNLQAAIGLGQIERVETLVADRRRVFLAYQERLSGLALSMNPEPEGCVNGYWMPTIVVDPELGFDRSALMAAMDRAGIDARVFFYPLSAQPPFAPYRRHSNLVAESIAGRALNLPSYHALSTDDIDRVCRLVAQFVPRRSSR